MKYLHGAIIHEKLSRRDNREELQALGRDSLMWNCLESEMKESCFKMTCFKMQPFFSVMRRSQMTL